MMHMETEAREAHCGNVCKLGRILVCKFAAVMVGK